MDASQWVSTTPVQSKMGNSADPPFPLDPGWPRNRRTERCCLILNYAGQELSSISDLARSLRTADTWQADYAVRTSQPPFDKHATRATDACIAVRADDARRIASCTRTLRWPSCRVHPERP